ncbi:acyl-CoA-like ligand-binding transcription factor [Dactylosporangium matsuzakiense]|uniref:TetR family transcriptional regulator n=1 Tax=Dactylosporangium matsuzakiense TaxID=53360 RepID=A0A9W6KLR4_9ACTN|nr:TetR family transcriptional regulator [Dactylosporangium matsuzakiense]UWZ48030.1 TetR family transcriptional regulator [Dactylosporangium matsuzakiense]GLL03513.1 TetR family transcriptional regulator [Dactylosporangium matsuzakiense]
MGLREQTREAVRAAIAERALDLFDRRGFDNTSVDDVAAAAGISGRSFHRYFPAKEDAVIGESTGLGQIVADALAERPVLEPPWLAMRAALQPIVELSEANAQRSRLVMRVVNGSASLRARNLEKHLAWSRTLTPIVRRRLGDPAGGDVPAQAIVLAALSCLDAAYAGWVAGDGGSLADLLDLAFDSVATG